MANPRNIRNDRLIFEDTSGAPVANSIVPCLLCMKPFWMLPFLGEPDQLCPECQAQYADTAKVVCNGRGKGRPHRPVTIARLPPGRLEDGYYVRPNVVLHSSACNICQPGIKESSILEIEQWEKSLKPNKLILSKVR